MEQVTKDFIINFNFFYYYYGLNMVVVPANMSRLSFGPCKKKNLILVPTKFFVF